MTDEGRERRFPFAIHLFATGLIAFVFAIAGDYWVVQNVEDTRLQKMTGFAVCGAALCSSSALTGLSRRLKTLHNATTLALVGQEDADD